MNFCSPMPKHPSTETGAPSSATMVPLLAAAWAIDPVDSAMRVWFLVALVLSLAMGLLTGQVTVAVFRSLSASETSTAAGALRVRWTG